MIKKIPVVLSDSDSDDDEASDKPQGAFCSSQQYPKTDMQEKRNDAEELVTGGSAYSITALIKCSYRTYPQINIALFRQTKGKLHCADGGYSIPAMRKAAR